MTSTGMTLLQEARSEPEYLTRKRSGDLMAEQARLVTWQHSITKAVRRQNIWLRLEYGLAEGDLRLKYDVL